MTNKKLIILFVVLIFVINSCGGANSKHLLGNNSNDIENAITENIKCDQLPTTYSNYNKAISIIKTASFKIKESANTSKSSWINSASYFSCDGNTGYFIFVAKGKEYIHIGVPYSVWSVFKSAESFGSFYNKNIKHKYHLYLNQ